MIRSAWICASNLLSMAALSMEAGPAGKGTILLPIGYASKERIERYIRKNMRDIYQFGLTCSIDGFHFQFSSKQ